MLQQTHVYVIIFSIGAASRAINIKDGARIFEQKSDYIDFI